MANVLLKKHPSEVEVLKNLDGRVVTHVQFSNSGGCQRELLWMNG